MKLFEELKTRNISFKNRLVMPPMATAKADDKGHITDDILDYYQEKTKDKLFSTVIVEHYFVEKRGKASKNQMSIASDSCIDGLKKLSDLIKKNESNAIVQISHAGSSTNSNIIGESPVGPSRIRNPSQKQASLPRELEIEEIKEIEDSFAEAAFRAKEAGFDGVEIHSAHGYLLNQILSPITNKRTDQYGGDIEGRISIHLEIIRKIRKKVGEDYPIYLRMGAGDNIDGGLSSEEAVFAAKKFEKAGIDVLDISGGLCMFSIEDKSPGFFDFLSKPIYEEVEIPVILTGELKLALM